MAKMKASERILCVLASSEDWLPVHRIANILMDVSACSVSARLRELARTGQVQKRRNEKPYDEWALVKSQRYPEDFD